MPSTFIAIDKAVGLSYAKFTVDTSSTPALPIEIRIDDTDGAGHAITKSDVQQALKALEVALLSSSFVLGTNKPNW